MSLAAVVGLIVLALGPAWLRAAPPPAPAWVLEVAARPNLPTAASAPAVVLFDEWNHEVLPDGRMVLTVRHVVRILNRSGAEQASASVYYRDKDDSVKATNAWLVREGKTVTPPKKREWADVSAASSGAIFDESRKRTISYEDVVCLGDVFAYETRVERRMLFGQVQNLWHCSLPTLVDRFVLRLPPGWSCVVVARAGNAAGQLKETVAGQTRTWELLDRPYRPDEPAMADGARLDALVAINLAPPQAGAGSAPFVPRDWAAAADWDWKNSLGQCDTNAALAAEAKKLTADCADPLARIRALSRYVQQLRYVGVNKNLAIGHGYRPRKATEVLARGWGDCKDKANLMVALLREVGIEAFLASAQTEEGRLVNPDWPSLNQFNHAIVAIRVDDTVKLEPIVDVPGAGRLLFFDATSPTVLLGDLPWALQGSKVQVVFPGNSGLTTLPVLPTERFHVFESTLDLELAGTGAVGKCTMGGPGRAGAFWRGLALWRTEKEQREYFEERIGKGLRGAQIQAVSASDDPVTGDRRVAVEFTAPRFGQSMPGVGLIVRLDLLGRDYVPAFPEIDRSLPIGLTPALARDEIRLRLPDGYAVEEMPKAVQLQSAFGRYSCAYETSDRTLVVHRSLQLEDRIVPVAEYAALKKFLGEVAKADRSSVVLRQTAEAAPAAPAAPAK